MMSFSLVIAAAQKKIAFPNLFFISVPFNWPRSTLTHSLGGDGWEGAFRALRRRRKAQRRKGLMLAEHGMRGRKNQ